MLCKLDLDFMHGCPILMFVAVFLRITFSFIAINPQGFYTTKLLSKPNLSVTFNIPVITNF